MSKNRVEAFSDGVLAVAITLLALNLRVPDPGTSGSLGHNLGAQWPSYAAYVVSFLTIGVIWINHQAMMRRLVAVDHSLLALNLILLLTVAVLCGWPINALIPPTPVAVSATRSRRERRPALTEDAASAATPRFCF